MNERPDPPTDGELWDAERLHEHGRHLAELEGTYRGADRPDLNRRLKANAAALESAYATIVEALQAERAITPAAEWIVDNFHVISEQLGEVPLRLTPKLWRKLPATAHPQATSWPRIYHIAREYLRYRLWEFDPESLVRMLDGYQELRPLRMAEIWALYPILRIVLIDELRRIAVRVEDSLDARAAADDLADWLAGDEDGRRISAASETLAQAENLPSPFTVQLVRRLHGLGKPGLPVLDAFAQGLARHDTSIDDSIQRQHIRRSASNLAARNIITSLRQLASFDWRTLFERTAHVEALLRSRQDYLVCDRRTRDRYRHSIEDLAIASNRHEVAVTRQVLQLVPDAAVGDAANGDLGSWLIGPQRIQLEETLLSPVSAGRHLRRAVLRFAEPLYLGGIGILTLLLVGVALQAGTDLGATSIGALLLLAVLAAFPASELAIGILNRVWLRAFPPRHLPRHGLETGLDENMKTLVVVPTLLRSVEDAVDACRQLQVHALANADPHITFALLSDWTDSPTESRADDAAVLDAARREIARLNADVAAEGQRFYLLHRKRVWSAGEGRFIGWERKRGKLEELNRLLLGHGETSFLPDADGLVRRPEDIRYVLTVDADTRLPLGSVKDLVGVAMHPLNHPVIDAATGRVTRGYGVLQPRITPLLPAIDERSLYREIVTSGSGIDPYAAAVSDLYQDVFGEGLFTGKGLYDLAAWDKAMQGRVPPEALLSHDMFEGLFARCGLVSDIEFFEDFPSNSEVAAARQHRWIRGDWQLLPWVMGLHGALPALGRWKMLDNLRRSLLAPLSLALLVTAFIVPPANPFVWLLLMLAPSVIPATITAIERLFDLPAARSRRMHLHRTVANFAGDMARAAVSLAMLAQNSWLSIDAIGRAVYRLTISRRKLLEWVTAAQLKASRSGALASFVWPMKSASIVVVATVAIFMLTNHTALALFAPLLLVWWLTPVLAQFLSKPLDVPRASEELPAPVEQELRATARLTWTFFEQFVTAEDNFLPPDNFQEDPAPVVAHRSSPTNMGLYLLSAVAARDFGWLGLHDLAARLQATLASLQKLERFRGHFLNWYDTRTLAPLLPQYVSTVDSGNLAGHLLTLRQACIRFRNGPLLSPRALTGPLDALYQCRQAWLALPDDQGAGSDTGRQVLDALLQMELRLTAPHATLAQVRETLESVVHALATLQPMQRMPAGASRWLQVARQDIESQLLDLRPLPAARANLPLDVTLEHAGSEAPGEYTALLAALASVEKQCGELFDNMSFAFLLDKRRGLFSIGYRIADATLDESYYDLLASEARLASLVAIAKGDAPRSHWFRLGRRLTGGSARPVLASWSGSMFEYLMPALVMQEPRFSLLDQTNRRVVWQQIRYGGSRNLPWGISESAYNVRDRHYTYQYSAFGVPTLGLKRGLASDYVIAPYATALASMYRPVDASLNLRALAQLAGRGEYGFYESLDFTTGRVPNGRQVAVVHSYFAHHQGMSLVALGNVLNDSLMQQRFHADPRIAAVDLLLQERRIRFVEAPAFVEADVPANRRPEDSPDVARTVEGHATPTPVMHLLSNRHYTVMVTDSGGGFSSCRGKAVTRWREDATRDCWGTFIYLRDSEERRVWSAGFQPTAALPDDYHAHFNEESVAIARRDGSLRTTMTVVVAPDDDGELRQVTLRNDGTRPRHVELTSYAEIVLAPLRADIAHPGFSNLFVQTEFVADCGALLATRRPRSDRESAVWAAHVIAGHAIQPQSVEYETDRARFIGRGRSNRNPQALEQVEPLSRTVGNVLDPVFSLRSQVTVPARGSRTLTFATFMAGSREQVLQLVRKYRAPALFEHVMQSAWTFARAELHYLSSSLGEARLFQALVAHLLVDTQQLRAATVAPAANVLDVSYLWRFAISGDRPILVIRCHSPDEMPFVRQCLRAQEYLRVKQVLVDVVVLNERRHSYMQDLQQAIEYTVREFSAHAAEGGERGGIYALTVDGIGAAERLLLLSLARVVMDPAEGSLLELLSRPPRTRDPELKPPPRSDAPASLPGPSSVAAREALEFFNGFGGFADEGREYVLALGPGTPATPAPWSNVLANEHFGALVTERGSLCTWSLNSRENQLTPWSNDPVCDPSGECFYLMDDSGAMWSPAPQPIQLPQARYDIRHGQGYSRFDLSHAGVETRLTVFVATADPVKVCHLRITNRLATTRRLRIGTYVEWALGAARVGTNRNVQTRVDPTTSAHFARNPALIDFGNRVAFCDLGGRQQHCSDSRHEFIGRNGSTAAPAGLLDPSQWTMAHGPGHDACCVFAVDIELAPGGTEDLMFVLGQAANEDQARQLVLAYRQHDPDALLRGVKQHWRQLLGAVQIHTPDRALDLFFNQWLLYQTMACRLWGRAAFYQAGGAYGFRDQLQDVMAVMQAAPEQARAQLLRAAARQYPEGDAQHWWHPPSGRGVRTHISDDRVWLPYVLCHYLDCTNDIAVLDEMVPFIEGPPLTIEQEDSHYVPQVSALSATLYEHSARALDVSLATGAHGLPLMGGGDWNDGMNRVGHAGRGESVWLAWLLIATLERFIPVAAGRGDAARVDTWRTHRQQLIAACEREAWDGQWYRRAYFDDGTPLGSRHNAECRIDSLSQSWAVISRAADPQRARMAMAAVEQQLQREDDGIVLLFTPPFDRTEHDPGYIKGYLPGLRENGGQYTHAAVWVLMAQAMLGRSEQVAKLLQILNPVRHSDSREAAQAYRVEPYALAADIYAGAGLAGRGGWTWYTGAAGWLYRVVLEHVLGIRIRAQHITVVPCVPAEWPAFEVRVTLPGVDYTVAMRRADVDAPELLLDGSPVAGDSVPLLRDGSAHRVEALLPRATGAGGGESQLSLDRLDGQGAREHHAAYEEGYAEQPHE